MNDTKHDIEKIGESTSRKGGKALRFLTKWTGKMIQNVYRAWLKYFTNPTKAVEKDGATKRMAASPPLTKEEVKDVIAKAREEDVLVCVKEMQPDGDYGKGKSLHAQEKIAKKEIKARVWKERSKTYKKVPVLNKFCLDRANKFTELSKAENKLNTEKRYMVICNESRVTFMNDCLESIEKKRIQKLANNELEDIDKNGIVDQADAKDLHVYGMEIEPEELQAGRDYGSCRVNDYHSNFCTQVITKEEYCLVRREMFDMVSHGAYVLNDEQVLVAFPKEELSTYKQYGFAETAINEYGFNGGDKINSESNQNDLISMELEKFDDMKTLREKYVGKDYIAVHNPNGKISVLVKETDTERMVEIQRKKSTTSVLLQEAKEFMEKEQSKAESTGIEKVMEGLQQELEEAELDR